MSIYSITRINRWSSSDDGETIQLELTIQDGSTIALRCAYRDAARLAQAVVQAAAIAEKIQKKMPGQQGEVTAPYMASGVRSGSSLDGKFAALVVQTSEGVPVQITMTPSLARETIERLSA